MNYKLIEIKKENHIATVALNRVDALNALNYQLATEITELFRELAADVETWVIILKSNARIFCAGLDLKDMKGMMSNRKEGTTKPLIEVPYEENNIFECCHAIEDCKKPVIAAVHGKCVGAGLDIIAACDLRLCTQDASFSLREVRIGIAADMGVLQRLPLVIGQMFTRQMAYTGRFFSAVEVEKMGLVLAVLADENALMAAAFKLAEEILESAPLAVQSTKETINYSRFATIRDGMAKAIEKNRSLLFDSKDCKESLIAFMEKRKPNFKGV